jgi:hypothetical protein
MYLQKVINKKPQKIFLFFVDVLKGTDERIRITYCLRPTNNK